MWPRSAKKSMKMRRSWSAVMDTGEISLLAAVFLPCCDLVNELDRQINCALNIKTIVRARAGAPHRPAARGGATSHDCHRCPAGSPRVIVVLAAAASSSWDIPEKSAASADAVSGGASITRPPLAVR